MIVPGLYPYTDYTNYTDYTPYTRYTANPEKSTGIEIPAWLIRKIYKRTRPMLQLSLIHIYIQGGTTNAEYFRDRSQDREDVRPL